MKVLLLDAAFAAAPIYNHLVRAGHEVWVMGNREADLLARKAGERWIQQDYSRVDEVRAHVERLNIEAVVPGCTDVSMDTSLALRMNPQWMDSPETNNALCNKAAFRRICAELKLPAPMVVPPEAFPRPGRFICKPVDAFSGRGITVFDGEDRAALALALEAGRQASRSGEALVETFSQGPLHSCSAFIEGGRIRQAFYVIEGSSANPFAVDTSHLVHDVSLACTRELESSLERLCAALQLKDGLLHTQFILDGEQPFIVELARRCPGDLYPLLIEYSTGYEYAAAYASYFVGARHPTSVGTQRHVLRHTVTSMDDAVFDGLSMKRPLAVRAYYPIQSMGQDLFARQRNRAGILFTESANNDALRQDYEAFMARDAYDVAW